MKIASKMGISTIQSYQGSQIFEAVGISKEVIDKYFTNTVSRVGGITIADIQKDVEDRHQQAFDPLGLDIYMDLPSVGAHKFRSGSAAGAAPVQSPDHPSATAGSVDGGLRQVQAVHRRARPTRTSDDMHLRSLLEFNYPETGVPIEEVEERGLHRQALQDRRHELRLACPRKPMRCLAIAMNRLGGKSNTGEGGEDEER